MRGLLLVSLAALFAGGAVFIALRDQGGNGSTDRPIELAPQPSDAPTARIPLGGGVASRAGAADPADAEFEGDPAPLSAQHATGVTAQVAERNQLAIAALEAGDRATAIAGFEACLAAAPDEPVFSANLAEALVRDALAGFDLDPAAALAKLQRARELAPSREELDRLAERWTRVVEAQADFALDLSEHFSLRYDGERGDLMGLGWSRILDVLERSWHEFAEFFEGAPPLAQGERISVVLYQRATFDRVTGLGDWAGGAFDGTLRIPVEDFRAEESRLERVLRHELVHAFVARLTARASSAPGWLNEGLAQFLEPEYLDERSGRWRRACERLAGTDPFPLEQLEGSLSGWQDAKAVTRAYDQSLAFTGWIERHWGDRTLVRLVREAASVADSFQAHTGVPLSGVFADFSSSLKR